MSDDEPDLELLALLRQSLGLGPSSSTAPPSTGVLKDAQYICDNSIDVAISHPGTVSAAKSIWQMMQQRHYSTETWSEHELHPKEKSEDTINFIFTMNLLNFSFWSELSQDERFAIEYQGKRHTGYWSLVAALRRAIDEGYPVTSPSFWIDQDASPDSVYEHIFRSATDEPMPLLSERITILREAGSILEEHFDLRPINIINDANGSAARMVNLLVEHFPNFQDISVFHGKKVKLYKRAQIMVADLWACYNAQSPCSFYDIDHLTTFPDYRIPQMLRSLGVLLYSPRLETMIRNCKLIPHGSVEEVELRGCSVWAVELLRREIEKLQLAGEHAVVDELSTEKQGEKTADDVSVENGITNGGCGDGEQWNGLTATATDVSDEKSEEDSRKQEAQAQKRQEQKQQVNAVLIDFFLYDCAKEKERDGEDEDVLPHHRTRSIFY